MESGPYVKRLGFRNRRKTMRGREQKGHVWREGKSWLLRYRDTVVEDCALKRKQLTHNLGPVAPEHARLKRPPETVLEAVKQFLAKLNSGNYDPERNVTLLDFVNNVWLPHIENRHAASTVHSHRYYWEHLLKPRCLKAMLRDFSTPDGQKLLDEIARH